MIPATVQALNAMRADRLRVAEICDAFEDDQARLAAWHRGDITVAFDFLAAVIDARFLTLRSALRMTREVIAQ